MNGLERRIAEFTERPLRPGDPHLPAPKGTLLIIGGHEDKDDGKIILRRVAQLTGSGKLVIATLASEEPREVWETYEPLMRRLGVSHVHHLQIEERGDCSTVRAMRTLEDATCVFFTGGDQLRITSTIGDTPVYSRTFEIFLNGGTIAGTSAGASVMSETMMVGGNGEKSHRIGASLQLAPGFGFARDMVIDQHFSERGRVSRLLGVLAQNPRILGIGIDEDTAIELQGGRQFDVLGSGAVTVLDGRTVGMSNVAEEAVDRTMSLFGVTLHVLSQGDRFDLLAREPETRAASVVDEEVGISAGD